MKNLKINDKFDYSKKLDIVKYSIAPAMSIIGFSSYYLEDYSIKASIVMAGSYLLTGLVGTKIVDLIEKDVKEKKLK